MEHKNSVGNLINKETQLGCRRGSVVTCELFSSNTLQVVRVHQTTAGFVAML